MRLLSLVDWKITPKRYARVPAAPRDDLEGERMIKPRARMMGAVRFLAEGDHVRYALGLQQVEKARRGNCLRAMRRHPPTPHGCHAPAGIPPQDHTRSTQRRQQVPQRPNALEGLQLLVEFLVFERRDNRADGVGTPRYQRTAAAFGTQSSCVIAARTRARVFSVTFSGSFRYRETVAVDTPATRATSANTGSSPEAESERGVCSVTGIESAPAAWPFAGAVLAFFESGMKKLEACKRCAEGSVCP